jgi:hypothetical protein
MKVILIAMIVAILIPALSAQAYAQQTPLACPPCGPAQQAFTPSPQAFNLVPTFVPQPALAYQPSYQIVPVQQTQQQAQPQLQQIPQTTYSTIYKNQSVQVTPRPYNITVQIPVQVPQTTTTTTLVPQQQQLPQQQQQTQIQPQPPITTVTNVTQPYDIIRTSDNTSQTTISRSNSASKCDYTCNRCSSTIAPTSNR